MNIRLDPKHGVNPSVEQCFYCMGDKGVVLFGHLTPKQRKAFADSGLSAGGDEAPRKVCVSMEPCTECAEHMEEGIILISVSDDATPIDKNPKRTGKWVVVRERAVHRMLGDQDLIDQVVTARFAFIPDAVWKMLELPEPN